MEVSANSQPEYDIINNHLARVRPRVTRRDRARPNRIQDSQQKDIKEKVRDIRKVRVKVERREKVIHRPKNAKWRKIIHLTRIKTGMSGTVARRINLGQRKPNMEVMSRRARIGGQKRRQ